MAKTPESVKKAQKLYDQKITHVNVRLNPKTDPEIEQQWRDLVDQHGGEAVRGSQAAALRSAILATKQEHVIDEILDMSRTVVLPLRIEQELLDVLTEEAELKGIGLNDLFLQKLTPPPRVE